MAKVNRFSRPAQVAKFDPLSAEDIMRVPLTKQVMEDTQRTALNEKLTEMYNMRAVNADQARTNEIKQGYQQRFDDITNHLNTYGIDKRSLDKVNSLKQDYAKELSLSGGLGAANQYALLQDEERKRYNEIASKNSWGDDFNQKFWDISSRDRSAFGEDGTFKTTYEGIGSPDYMTPEDSFMARAKSLGKSTTPEGIISNKKQLDNLFYLELNKYSNPASKEYRALVIQMPAGSTHEQVVAEAERRLTLAHNSAISSLYDKNVIGSGSRTGRGVIPKKTQAEVKAESDLADDILFNTGHKIQEYKGLTNLNDMSMEAANAKKAITDAKSDSERAEAEDYYQTVINRNLSFQQAYEKTASGVGNKNKVDTALNKLPSGIAEDLRRGDLQLKRVDGELKFYDVAGEVTGQWRFKNDADRAMNKLFAFGNNEEVLNKVSTRDGLDKIDKEKLEGYYNAQQIYINDFNSTVDDASKSHSMVPIWQMQGENKAIRTQYEDWERGAIKDIKASHGGYDFQSMTGYKAVDGKVAGEGTTDNSYTRILGKDENKEITNDELTTLFNSSGIEEMNVSQLTTATNHRNPGGILTVKFGKVETLPKAYSHLANQTINIDYVVNASGKNVNSTRNIYSTGLQKINNKGFKNMADINETNYRYSGILYPSTYRNEDYYNSDNISRYFKSAVDPSISTKGNDLLNEGTKPYLADIYLHNDGGYRFGYASGKDKPQMDLTIGKLTSMLLDREGDSKKASQDSFARNYLNNIISSMPNIPQETNFPRTIMGQRQYNSTLAAFKAEMLSQLKKSNSPIVVRDYRDFYKLLQ